MSYKTFFLPRIPNNKGDLFKFIRSDDQELFIGFGECYFSSVKPFEHKGIKLHKLTSSYLLCVSGSIEFRIYSDNYNFDKVDLSAPNLDESTSSFPCLFIPSGTSYSFYNPTSIPSLILSFTSMPHDPSESLSFPLPS